MGIEVGLLWNLIDNRYIVLHGKEYRVSMKENKLALNLLLSAPEKSLVFMHNHPNSSSFSNLDISSFITYKSLYAATAVGHNGTIFSIRREKNFDEELARNVLNTFKDKILNGSITKIRYKGYSINLFGTLRDTIIENSSILNVTYRESKK